MVYTNILKSPKFIKRIGFILLICILVHLVANRDGLVGSSGRGKWNQFLNDYSSIGSRSELLDKLHLNQKMVKILLKTKISHTDLLKQLQSDTNDDNYKGYKNVATTKKAKRRQQQSKTHRKHVETLNNKKGDANIKVTTRSPDTAMRKITGDKGIVRLPSNFSSRQEILKYIQAQKIKQINSDTTLKFARLNMRWNSGNVAEDYYRRIIRTDKEQALSAGLKNECFDWTYDVADYTVVYKPNKRYQVEKCSYPTNETIKKIVMPNKDVVWKGCTRKTALCSENPHFDTKRNLRRNVPPCCRHHLLEMLGNIDRELTRRKITYTLTDGAVIGWYRNKKLVPYDRDIDMYVDGAYFKTRTWDEVFKGLAVKYGYEYVQTEDYKYRLRYSAVNGLQVDIWPYFNIKLRTHYGEVKPGEWLTFVYHSGTTAMRVNEFFPPKRTTIEGVPCNVPRDTVNYLNKNYGPTPDHWFPELTCKTFKSYGCHT